MTSADEDTDPHASDAPPSLSGEQQFRDALSSLLDAKLAPLVDEVLVHKQEHTSFNERISKLEMTRYVVPIAISTAALVVAVISLVLSARGLSLGLW